MIELLERHELEEALNWLDFLIHRELDEEKLVNERKAIKGHDEALGKRIQPILRKYIKKGHYVVELFNGDRSDILRALADLVGKQG
ncbi:MAG: hypothetical protein ACQESG_03945 [Nanobdellota archaeon]